LLLSFPVIVYQTLGFPAGEITKIIYFLYRENLSVAYHCFEGRFPWMEKTWIPAKGVRVPFEKVCLVNPATICLLEDASISIRWLADVSLIRVEAANNPPGVN